MATEATVNQLSKTDAAYIAGMIDGEGTITLIHEQSSARRHLIVTIGSAERLLLEHIQSTIGHGKIIQKPTHKTGRGSCLQYKITDRLAFVMLGHIAPFLRGAMRERATHALANYLPHTPRKKVHGTAELREIRDMLEETLRTIAPDISVIENGLEFELDLDPSELESEFEHELEEA